DWDPMPPKESNALTGAELGWIKQWIAAGAPWPEEARLKELAAKAAELNAGDGVRVRTSGGLSEEWTNRPYQPEDLWAYRPLRKPVVPPSTSTLPHPIDRLLAAKFP